MTLDEYTAMVTALNVPLPINIKLLDGRIGVVTSLTTSQVLRVAATRDGAAEEVNIPLVDAEVDPTRGGWLMQRHWDRR